MKPSSQRLLAFGLFLTGVIFLITYRPAVQQDLFDGTYSNPDCPGFEVRSGELRFDQTRLQGTVERSKTLALSADRELQYSVDRQGCRLVLVDQWARHPAITREAGAEVTGIVLYSADRSENRVWKRVSLTTP